MIPKFRGRSFVCSTKSRHIECVCGGRGNVGKLSPLDSSSEPVAQLVNKLPNFHVTRRFIIVFTTIRNWTIPEARWILFTSSRTVFLRLILIVTFRLILRHKSFLPFRLSVWTSVPTGDLSKHVTYRSLFHSFNDARVRWKVLIVKLLIMEMLAPCNFDCRECPHSLNAVLSLCSLFRATDHVWKTFKTAVKIALLQPWRKDR